MDLASALIIVVIFHCIFDFVFQSDWMAKNKSKNINALLSHVGVYTFGMLIAGVYIFGPTLTALIFGVGNGFVHLVVDYFTSRASSYLWEKNRVHDFFVVIGFDQLLHMVTIILTLDSLL